MAHYAFIDDQNIVTEVIVGRDENEGVDWERHYGEARGQRCLRTSYHTFGGQHLNGGVPFRLNYAGLGYSWREDLQGFIPPCPSDGYTLDEAAGVWVAPA